MKKAIGLWSGGKDSCFACYKAKLEGCEIVNIINFADSGGSNSISHGLSSRVIEKQADSIDIPFLQKPMPDKEYRREFIELIGKFKKEKGIKGVVFGDIYLQEHKDWIDSVCAEAKIEGIFPVWTKDTEKLINDIINAGFKSIAVSVRKGVLGEEWLGREVDAKFVNDLKTLGNIDLCGEKGEFHTFVYDGPLFKKPVNFRTGKKIPGDKYWFLEVI
jgi:uncharacterized protein (TIGR00290 family)